MKRASALLPISLPPFGVNREQAAALVGISASLFDRLVRDGQMPDARTVGGRLIWDVEEIAAAFRSLPHRTEALDPRPSTGNPWD